jgi:NAD(P)-dependent dehydrogenase (short-subunit alcohol dehydrogenase family)
VQGRRDAPSDARADRRKSKTRYFHPLLSDDRRVAFVTGASRGIGKAIAHALAAAGYDVAITARTVNEGEAREHSSTVKQSNTTPLPGSLSSTAQLIEAEGRAAMVLPADLTDFASLDAAVARVQAEWGRIDVLVNNGRYIGPGHMDRLLDTPIELLDTHFQANVLAILVLCKAALPAMIARGDGTIVNITSGAGFADPTQPAGEGGWGVGYGMSKAAMHRIAGILAVEHGSDGIRAYNVQPGLIATERIAADMGGFGFAGGAPPAVVGAVVTWLLANPEAVRNGSNVEAQPLCHELGLLPDWPGPIPNTAAIAYDLAPYEAMRLEDEIRAQHGLPRVLKS